MTAKIKVNAAFNLPYIAEQAGQPETEKRFYKGGFLHVEDVTQKALDDALAAYDDAVNGVEPQIDELEALKETLKRKGILSDQDIESAKTTLKTQKIEAMRAEK